MFSVNWVFDLWAEELRMNLVGGTFQGAVSFDKDTLFLQFTDVNRKLYTLECKFLEGHLLLMKVERNELRADKRKGIVQFKEVENSSIAKIENDPLDRWISIELSNHYELWIKGFGKFGNVLLRNKEVDETISIFRLSLKSDWEFQYPSQPQKPDISVKGEVQQNQLNPPRLIATERPRSVIQLQAIQQTYLKEYYFERTKTQLKDGLERKIKHFKKILSESERRLIEIANRRSYKELGDLLLAHAHSIKTGISKALITDYYTDQRIWIKLNPELSATENAKKYYGKAKNEAIEKLKLEQQLEQTTLNLSEATMALENVLRAVEFKQLKSQQKTEKVNFKPIDNLPYRLHEYQGFQIWVGKNNKSNDQLLKLSQKNDLWLHAKDVTGSHVIIKKKGAEFPQAVIQFAANLAAKNSKAKTQQVVSVIAVPRKFVSKPKNAAVGEVSLQKETVIDAYINH
jgi:predicted ribosome quality control (RQC) complex YloA/Tae2 family protein